MKTGENLWVLKLGRILIYSTKKSMIHLKKLHTKNLCSVKSSVKRMKRQAMHWERIFASHISDKRLVSGIYKKLSNSTIRNKQANFKISQRLE